MAFKTRKDNSGVLRVNGNHGFFNDFYEFRGCFC